MMFNLEHDPVLAGCCAMLQLIGEEPHREFLATLDNSTHTLP
jgi:hypothetical protein